MSDLTAKFAGLQSQLSTQHAQILELLGWIRQDIADIKSDVDNIRVSAANGATWGQQTASNTLDIYNRLATLNQLYSYLTTNQASGGDLLSRIADLQTNLNDVEGIVGGFPAQYGQLYQASYDILQQLIAVRVSVAPNAESSLYTRVNSMAGWLNVIYQATTGNVGSWTGTTIMQYLEQLKDSAQSIQATNSSIDGQLVNVIDGIEAIRACACEPVEPDPCASGTPLAVDVLATTQGLYWVKPGDDEQLGNLTPLEVDSWIDPVAFGGSNDFYITWNTAVGIIPVGSAEFCVQNGSEFATVFIWFHTLDDGPPTIQAFTCPPGQTQHFAGGILGPNTWLALGIEDVPTDLDQIKIIVFAAG